MKKPGGLGRAGVFGNRDAQSLVPATLFPAWRRILVTSWDMSSTPHIRPATIISKSSSTVIAIGPDQFCIMLNTNISMMMIAIRQATKRSCKRLSFSACNCSSSAWIAVVCSDSESEAKFGVPSSGGDSFALQPIVEFLRDLAVQDDAAALVRLVATRPCAALPMRNCHELAAGKTLRGAIGIE